MVNSSYLTDVLILVAGAYITSSWMMWWFNTSLQIHILEVLRWMGWRKNDTQYWSAEVVPGFPKVDLNKWTRKEFEDWVHSKNTYLAELVTCPGCFSFHVAFWVSLVLNLLCLFKYDLSFERVLVFILGWFAWPSFANKYLKSIKG
jgi:hypothetical protein